MRNTTSLLITISLLLLCTPLIAEQGNIGRGLAPDKAISWINQYDNFYEKATNSGNKAAQFKVVQIIDLCWTAVDESVSQSCQDTKVEPAHEGLSMLIALADSGFVPAQIYFSRSVPVAYDLHDAVALDQYKSLRDAYIASAVAEGSGEAMFLLASDIRRVSPRSLVTQEQALEAYSYASAAVKCGYTHGNAYGLLNFIVEKFEVEVAQAKEKTAQLVEQYCDEGGE